jgi:hypothetical protein
MLNRQRQNILTAFILIFRMDAKVKLVFEYANTFQL